MGAERLRSPPSKAIMATPKEQALQRSLAARRLDCGTNAQQLEPTTAQTVPGQFAWTLTTIPILPPEAPGSALSPSKLPGSGILQTKLEIGAVDDPLEREADAVADRVMRMPDPAPSISAAPPRIRRKCADCEEEDEEKKVLMKPAGAAGSAGAVPPIVHQLLREPGRPLDAATRAFFEPRFGLDFSAVRLHLGPLADASARGVRAQAFAFGQDLVFRSGHFNPNSPSGKRLIAHELAHVAQQNKGLAAVTSQGASSNDVEGYDGSIGGAGPGTAETAVLRREPDQPNAAAEDPEMEAVLRAVQRAQTSPDDDTIMMLSASQMVYRLVTMFFPEQAEKISSVGYDRTLKGAQARQTGANIDIVVGKDFVLDVDPGRLLKPTLKLREMFRVAAAAPPGTAGGRGLISEMHANAAAAGRSAVEDKKYQDALTAHQVQQRRVNDLLKGFAAVPASPTKDQSNPDTKAHAYSTSFLKNTVEWIEKKIIPLYVLTPTHYSDVVYFDDKVAYPDIGGTYDPDLNKQAQDPNVVPVGNPTELGEAHIFRDEYNKSKPMSAASHIYLFVGRDEQLTMERLAATLEHEVQHIADFSPTVPAVAGQLDLNSVKQLYETEFRAYWLEAPVPELTCVNFPSGPLCQPAAGPPQAAPPGLSPPKTYGVHSFASASPASGAPAKPAPITVKGADVKGSCQLCGPNLQQTEVTSDFNNQRQQDIFVQLLSYSKDQFDCYYVCSREFRDWVHRDPAIGGKGVVAGQNVVNSVRIEELLENVRTCSRTLSAGDPKLAAVEDAARQLDAVDRAFLKDRAQAKPFWDVLNDRLPPFEVGKVTELVKP
jgi:Domain of unknown function (DUF4157)